jgi:hypothetical protein
MIVSEIHLYEMLKAKIGEKEAEAFVEILERKVGRKFDEAKTILATKEDLAKSQTAIIKWTVSLIIGLYLALTGTLIGIINLVYHSAK